MKKDGPRVYMKDLPEDQSFYFVEFSTSLGKLNSAVSEIFLFLYSFFKDPYSWQDDQAESNYHYKRPYCISDYLNGNSKHTRQHQDLIHVLI